MSEDQPTIILQPTVRYESGVTYVFTPASEPPATAAAPDLRSLLVAAQTATRAVEAEPTPQALRDLNHALTALAAKVRTDGAFFDFYEEASALIAQAVEESCDAATLKRAVSSLTATDLLRPIHMHPVMDELVHWLNVCYDEQGSWPRGSVESRTWERATWKGSLVLRELYALRPQGADTTHIEHTVNAFITAVRQAQTCHPLHVARTAVAEAARDLELFVIGGRQQLGFPEVGSWSREIGEDLYVFTATLWNSRGSGPRFGRCIVTRASDGARVHAFELTERAWKGKCGDWLSRLLWQI